MKQRLVYILPLLLSALVACQKKSISFGEEFTESFTNIIQIDTVTASLSTYKLDTFTTSGTNVAIVGKFNDAVFGTTTAVSYQQVGLGYITVPDISINAIYDSLTLILTPSQDYYGDTLLTQQINVHELTQTLAFPAERSAFYNTSSIAYDPVPLGSRSFTLKPNHRPADTLKRDTVEIKLSNTKGNDLFSRLRNKDNNVTTQEYFLRYLKGFALVPSSSSPILTNFRVADSTFKMRVYYHEPGVNGPNNLYIDFPVTNTNLQFNQIIQNRNVAPLSSLPATGFPEISSASLDHKAYLQDATGVFTKISFPYLQDLLSIDTSGKILKAELTIKPVQGGYDKSIYRMPPTLDFTVVNKRNEVIYTNPSNQYSLVAFSSNLSYDDLFGDNTGYTVDITSFLQREIKIHQEIRESLLVHTPGLDGILSNGSTIVYTTPGSRFNRLIMSDKTAGKYGIQVKLYYLSIR